MNEEYLRKLYDYLVSGDPTYADDVPFESFVSKMEGNQYAAQIYGYLGDTDPTYKQDVSVTDFLEKIRKKKEEAVLVSTSKDGLSEQPKTEIPVLSNIDLKGILENQKVKPRDIREDGYIDPMSNIGMYPDEETIKKAQAQQFADFTFTNEQIKKEVPVLKEVKEREEKIKKDQEEALRLERQGVIESPEFESALASIDKETIKQEEEQVVPLMNKLYGKYGFFFRQVGLGDAMEVVAPDGEVLEIDLDPYFDSTASEENIKLKNFIRTKVVKPSEAAETIESNPVVAAMKAKKLRDKSRLNPDGTESTVMMESAEVDGKFVAYPTLFPTNPDFYGRDPEWWTELEGNEAYKEALKRGEVFYFDTDKEAKEFAEGSWKDFTSVDAEADRFFKKRGADYIGYKTAYDNYENAMDAIEFIDRAPFRYDDLSDEEKAKYGQYYIDGKRRQDIDKFKTQAEAVADELRPVVNDSDNLTLREDFDVYMNEQFNIKAGEAAKTNAIELEKKNELQTESLQYFGLTLEQLSKYTTTNDNEKKKKDALLTGYKDAQAVSQNAANKYEVAETFFNAKFDENVHQQWVENWAATSNSWKSGYARGKAAEEILKIALGITDLDEDAELDEVSAAIVANLQSGQTGRMGRAEYRWHQARGFQESWDVFKDDPLELAGNFVAGSISQMLPYGWKIFSIGAGTGAATGAGIGATGFVTGPGGVLTTAGGALAGLGYGVKTSMAAISLSMEYTNAVLDAVSNQGYDPMNPNELKEALQDEAVWNEGRDIGLKRGIPIATIDFLSAGLAGRVFKVGSVAGRTKRIAAGLGERIVFDPLAEATGEYLAQINAGQEISGKEIFAEAWGGFGNNAPAAAVNMALDARATNNMTLANNLADINFIARESSSDSKISSWANNMERLGQISPEQNQRIQQNVGLRRDAKNLLDVGEGRVENLISPVNKGIQARTMELLAAKEELSSTPNRREVFRSKIKQINAELAEIAETKTLRPKEQQTILAGTGVVTLPEQSTATDIRQGIKKYIINGKAYTRQEFLSRIGDMNKKRLLKVNPQVINDDEVQNILNAKLDRDAVPIRETETLAMDEQAGVSEEVGEEVREETTEPTTLETQRGVEILALPEPVTRPTKEDKAAFENNTLEPERLDGILSAIVDKQLSNKKLTPFQQRIVEANEQRLQEIVSSKTLEQETRELEEVLALPEAQVTEVAPTEEETRLISDVDRLTIEIEDLQEEIKTEKQNLKEGLAELDAKIKEVRQSNRNRPTKAALIEELKAQKEDLKDEQNDLIDSYKEDIKGLKSDTRKAQRRIKKLEGQRQPKVSTPVKLYVAPFYNTTIDSQQDAVNIRQSEEYKQGIQAIKNNADALGIDVDITEDAIGGFVNEKGEKILEVTNVVTIKEGTSIDKVEELAALIAANTTEVQEATIAAQYVEHTSDEFKGDNGVIEYTVKTEKTKAQNVLDALKENDIYDFTYNENSGTLTLLDFSKGTDVAFDEKINKFAESLDNKGIKYEKANKRALESRYVGPKRRKEILRNLERDAVQQRQGGVKFYNSLISAIERSARFENQSVEEYLGKSIDDLKALAEQPKVDFRMREEGQFVPIDDEVREITDAINQQESGNVGTNLDETVEGVTIDVANLNERTTGKLPSIPTLQIIDGIPTIFTISDQLTVGTAVNPQTGTTIDNLKGGLGFNGTINNENNAWANTTEKEAADLLQKAVQVYEANKPTFEEFWAANPEINGLVPMAVVKMGEGSILSNEATFRVLQDNLTKIPRENKVNAMNALRDSIKDVRDRRQATVNEGKVTKTTYTKYLQEIAGYDAMLQLFDSLKVESIDDVVTNEFISFLNLPARRKLIERITYSAPHKAGAKRKNPRKGDKVVANTLIEGLDKESFTLIHLQPITDVITEPTLENVPQRNIIALQGVDVFNPEVITDVDHPNYRYGVKGRTIGVLENPVSITRAFPQAYQNAIAGLIAEEKKGKVITEGQRKRASKPEKEKMPEVGELAPSSVESILMQTVGVQNGVPGLEFVGALGQTNLPNVFKLTSFMNVAFPSVNISTDMNTFNNVIESDGVRVYLKGDEIIYGVTVDGDVYINPDVHNSESEVFNTAIHEMGHVWTDYLQTTKKGKTIYNKGVELVKQDPEYQKQLKRFNGDSQKAANETMAILIGNKGQTIADASLKSKFTEWLLGMWKYIKSQFTQTKDLTENQIQKLTLDEFIGAALADIFAGKEIKLTDAQLKKLKNPDAAFSMDMSMDAIIERGRTNGFSDASIREVLKSRGFKVADINQALEYQVDLFTTMPREFERIDGGILQSSKLFNDLRTDLNKWSTSGRPNIIGRRRVKTFAEIRQKAMELMKAHPIYQAQNDQVQMEIMSAFDRSLGYRANPSVQKEISAIRNNLRQRKIGQKNLREAQIRLKNFIRNSLPKSGIYSQAQINRLTKMITETNLDNFEAQALKVMEIVEKQREKIRKVRLKEIYKIVKTKAKPAMTKTGKRRAAGLDAIGQETFAAIKPVMDAVLKNDLEALEKINTFLNDNANEINEALDKYTRGEQLTTKESRLLAQQLAYDSFAELSTASLEEVETLLAEVKQAKKESILRFKTRRLERAARAKAVADLVTEQIEETNPALFDEDGKVLDANERNDVADDIRASLQKFKLKEAYQKIRGSFFKTKAGQQITAFKNWFRHLGTLTNLLDRVTDGKTMFTDYIYRRLNRADEMYNLGLFETKDKLNNIAKQAGIDGGMRGVDMLLHGIGLQQLEVIRSKTGRKRLTYLNGDQLLRIYALSKNPIQAQKLANQGITEEVISDIATILGPELTTYADSVVNFLSNEYYESINQVYATVNNVNLGFVENYFPTRTIQSKVNSKLLDDGDFNGIFNAETSPAFKERVDQKSDIELKAGDFTSVLNDHIQTMEKYKAFAETSQSLNDFFRVEAVDALLDVTGLKRAVKGAINFAINPMAGKNASGLEAGILESLQNKFTSFALAFKLVQIPKQASSFINAYEEYSYFPSNSRVPKVVQSAVDPVMFMVDAARVLGSMALDLVGKDGAIHQAMDMSATFRKRIEQGLEGDVYGLESGSQTFKPLDKSMSKVARARRALRTGAASPTIIGDVMGVMGYMINYKRNIANGMGQAEALEAFNNYNATQQSRRGTDKIPLQYSNNGLVRGFTMFGSTLFLQMNKVMSSATNMSRSISEGKMPRKQDIRAFYLNLAIANVLFTGVSNIMMFIKGDDEDREAALDKMRDAMLGLNLLYQIPYAGAMFESLDPGERLEALVAGKEYKKKRKMVDDVVNPFTSISFKVNRLMKEEGWTGVIRPTAELVMGVQLDPFIGMFNKAMKPEDLLEFDDNMYDILGISKSYRPEGGKKGKYEGIMPTGGIKTKSDLKRYSPELYELKYGEQDRIRKERKEQRAKILKSMGYKEVGGKLYPID